MDRVDIKELFAHPESYYDKTVTVAGWARTVRDSKAFGFVELNDGGCFRNLQVVLVKDELDNFDQIVHLGAGSAISATGRIIPTPEAKQPFELRAEKVTVEGTCAPDYPLQKKRHTMEYLRTMPHLRQRTNTLGAAYRMRSLAAFALHKFFNENGFVYMHTPIITCSDCEGAGEMFQVTTLDINNPPRTSEGAVDYSQDFFGRKVGLTVSGQLMGESAAMAFGRIYTFGPTFRAEKSYTTRHAAEFWMIEPEMAFCDLEGDMEIAEGMIKYVLNYCMEQAPDELEFFNKFLDNGLLARLNNVVGTKHFKRVTYTQAIELLQKSGRKFDYPVFWGCDLSTEHERYITEEVFGCPVFVTDYPKEIKSFYMKQNPDGKTVLVRLVGHHREAEALRLERRHQLQNARVGLRLDLAMRGVVRLVKRERLRDGLLVRVCAEGAAHLHLRAVADEAPHLRERPLGIAQLPQRVVRRTADVLERVEQRPVKVK